MTRTEEMVGHCSALWNVVIVEDVMIMTGSRSVRTAAIPGSGSALSPPENYSKVRIKLKQVFEWFHREVLRQPILDVK